MIFLMIVKFLGQYVLETIRLQSNTVIHYIYILNSFCLSNQFYNFNYESNEQSCRNYIHRLHPCRR